MAELAVYDNDPTLYLFTSLTAGSSHIVTATSRIETILKANRIPFKGVDTATDELARKLFQRRARGKKLPLLVKEGFVIADLEQIEEWNEYDELKEALGGSTAPAPVKPTPTPAAAPAPASSTAAEKKENAPSANAEQNLAIRQLGAEAAKVAAAKKQAPEKISTTNPLLSEKINSPAAATAGTPTKSADPSGILSPRSIPLPSTPHPATSAPSEEPTAPSSTTTATPPPSRPMPSPLPLGSPKSGSDGASPVTSYHGRTVSSPGAEEIRQAEKEQSIAEVSSGEEEDEEEEGKAGKGGQTKVVKEGVKKEDDEEDDEEEEESEDESESEENGVKGGIKRDITISVQVDEAEKSVDDKAEKSVEEKPQEKEKEKTQDQDAKDAAKAGESVED